MAGDIGDPIRVAGWASHVCPKTRTFAHVASGECPLARGSTNDARPRWCGASLAVRVARCRTLGVRGAAGRDARPSRAVRPWYRLAFGLQLTEPHGVALPDARKTSHQLSPAVK
jgi:hypothetical protein